MKRLAIPVAVLIALVAIEVGVRLWRDRAGSSRATAATSSQLRMLDLPMPVTAFTATDLDGRTVSLADWRGKYALVNVWATWCVPCRAEIPDLVALQAAHDDRLRVVGVLQDHVSPETARRFAGALKINYPVVFSTWDISAAFGEALVLPTSYLVNPEGLIVATQIGPVDPAAIARLITPSS